MPAPPAPSQDDQTRPEICARRESVGGVRLGPPTAEMVAGRRSREAEASQFLEGKASESRKARIEPLARLAPKSRLVAGSPGQSWSVIMRISSGGKV